MVSVNFTNWVTIGLMVLVFFAALRMLQKAVGVNIPGLPA